MTNLPKYEGKGQLTKEEKDYLGNYIGRMKKLENQQLQELFVYCHNKYQFAKTHSNYLKDWERTKTQMENTIFQDRLPDGVSPLLMMAVITESEKVIKNKLKQVREVFEKRFGESIYNYLGPDGKTRKIFGIFG